MVLVGDHQQLPGVVNSIQAKKLEFDVPLIKYLYDEFPIGVNFMLNVQHRFNNAIQVWSNREFYQGKLVASPLVKNIHIRDLIRGGKGLFLQKVYIVFKIF